MKTKLYWALPFILILVVATTKAQDHYLTFDGTNDYIALPISYNGLDAVPTVSVEAWVRTSFSGGGNNIEDRIFYYVSGSNENKQRHSKQTI